MKIITGKTATAHVDSCDDGGFNAGIAGSGDYVLNIGKKFEAKVIDNNTVQISDGELLMQGRHGRIQTNSSDTVSIANGAQGVRRMDVIVCEYSRNGDIESMELKVVKGTPGATETRPELTEGSILDGDSKHQMALYEVVLNSLDIESVVPVFSTINTMKQNEDALETIIAKMILADNKKKYPVGHILMSAENVNPKTYLGFGTWEAWGAGRVPVGVDSTQTEFNTSGKTGGAKTHSLKVAELPEHTHVITEHDHYMGHEHVIEAITVNTEKAGEHDHHARFDANQVAAGEDKHYYCSSGDHVSSVNGSSGTKFVAPAGEHQHKVTIPKHYTNTLRTETGLNDEIDSGKTGSNAAHNNLQPYITCYMFKRTA